VADGIDDPEQGDAEVLFAADTAALHGERDGVDVESVLPLEDADGDVGLGVANSLDAEVAEHVVGDGLVVGGLVKAFGDGLEAHEEAGEVLVAINGPGLFGGEGHGVVGAGEFDEGLGGNGAFEMEMQLRLGQAFEPCHRIDRFKGFGATRHEV
jgi:hypothetical protein